MSYTLISTDSIYSMYTITQYFVITTAYFDRLVSIYIVNKTICWFWNTIIFLKLCYAINSGVPWYILVRLWSWYRGLQKTLHRCIMVRDFEEYFNTLFMWEPWVGRTTSVSIKHKLYSFIHFFHMTCSLVIKIRTTGFFFQSFTHSCLVFSLQWKEMLDQGLTAVVTDLCCLFLLSLRYTHSLATVL